MGVIMTLLAIGIATVILLKLLSHIQVYAKSWVNFSSVTPMEKMYPLFGHALKLQGDSSEFYTSFLSIVNSIQRTGRELGCMWLGTHPVILITGPNAAEVLLRSSAHSEKSMLYNFLHPWLGTGLLTSKGEKWKMRRRLLTPSFHFSILNEFLSSMNEQSAVFTNTLDKYAKTGESFDIFKNITLCALDIICQTAMGEKINAQLNSESDYVKAIYRVSDIIQERQKSPWLWSDAIFHRTSKGKEFLQSLRILHSFSSSVISDRRNNYRQANAVESEDGGKIRRAFLDLLIEVSDDGDVLSAEDIREEVDTFMFEGHDTTAAGMAWAIHLIGCHPTVQRKIHEELDSIFPEGTDSEITSGDLRKMDYLERVVKESLRMFPSVPMMGRTTTSECSIGGQKIPRGTDCVLVTQVINNHPNYWDKPKRFDPDRFTVENSTGRHAYAYIPFSAGPRNCIGQKFALMEEKVLLAHTLRKFRVKSCDKTDDIRQMSDLILRPGDGINVQLERR